MKRELCSTCQRPTSVCYCSALVKVANKLKVLIIQHPLEEKHPFNTGRMAHLCLNNSELIIAETFTNSELSTLLSSPSALLYPSLDWLPTTTAISSAQEATTASIKQLVVIDATWRKSKKILHLHPALQQLPRVNLSGNLQSQYTVRKTSIADGLSTIESIVLALQKLEGENSESDEIFQSMLQPFEKMITMQQANFQK